MSKLFWVTISTVILSLNSIIQAKMICEDGTCIDYQCDAQGQCREVYSLTKEQKQKMDEQMKKPTLVEFGSKIKKQSEKSKGNQILMGKVITIDKRDQQQCMKMQQFLNLKRQEGYDVGNIRNLCEKRKGEDFVSLLVIHEADMSPIELKEYKEKQKYEELKYRYSRPEEEDLSENYVNRLPERYQNLLKSTGNIGILGLGVMGVLYLMPEGFTNWNKEDANFEHLMDNYRDHVKEGPIMDKDDWAVNYIGHSYSGAIYYMVAHHAGLNEWEAFGYTALMSTFFWEYGVEAFAETPSIQDLIITPVLGSLLGMGMVWTEKHIDQNDGKLFGQKWLGSTAKAIFDPLNTLTVYFKEGLYKVNAQWLADRMSFDFKVEQKSVEEPITHRQLGNTEAFLIFRVNFSL